MSEQSRATHWLKSPLKGRMEKLRMGASLEIRPYSGRKRKIRLVRTKYDVGSSAESSIFLDDPFVSAKHAEFLFNPVEGTFEIRNGSSKNGVYLNGVQVERAVLPERGLLKVGRSEITWSGETEMESKDVGGMIVADESMRAVLTNLKAAARSKLPILILGETGTGKELIARLVHGWSDRAPENFVTVNGASLGGSLAESELFGHRKGAFTGSLEHRRGAVSMAHRGSLFLDEVGDIPGEAQVKLLRALESGELKALGSDRTEKSDFRLIAATSRPLRAWAQEGRFRADLYYRIAGYVVEVPPLRFRKEDIVAIAHAQVMKHGMELGTDASDKLLMHDWPGNVRELRSVVERGIVRAKINGASVVSEGHVEWDRNFPLVDHGNGSDKPISLDELEHQFIARTLARNAGARQLSADQLGISRSTLFKKMQKYGIPIEPRGCGNRRR